MFTNVRPVYEVFVVYTVPINLTLGLHERFQYVEDGFWGVSYHEIQDFYRTWPYNNNIAKYVSSIKNKTVQKDVPTRAWELTLDYLNPILLRPFCFIVSTPDNNLHYIPCFNSIIRDEKTLYLLAAIQDKIDQQKHNGVANNFCQSTKNAYLVNI